MSKASREARSRPSRRASREQLLEVRISSSGNGALKRRVPQAPAETSITSKRVLGKKVPGRLDRQIIRLYATEQPNMLSVPFTIEHEVVDLSNDARTDGHLKLRGDGMYDANAASFASLRNYNEKLTWKLDDGTEKQSENHVAHIGALVLGHREVTHTVRYKLD